MFDGSAPSGTRLIAGAIVLVRGGPSFDLDAPGEDISKSCCAAADAGAIAVIFEGEDDESTSHVTAFAESKAQLVPLVQVTSAVAEIIEKALQDNDNSVIISLCSSFDEAEEGTSLPRGFVEACVDWKPEREQMDDSHKSMAIADWLDQRLEVPVIAVQRRWMNLEPGMTGLDFSRHLGIAEEDEERWCCCAVALSNYACEVHVPVPLDPRSCQFRLLGFVSGTWQPLGRRQVWHPSGQCEPRARQSLSQTEILQQALVQAAVPEISHSLSCASSPRSRARSAAGSGSFDDEHPQPPHRKETDFSVAAGAVAATPTLRKAPALCTAEEAEPAENFTDEATQQAQLSPRPCQSSVIPAAAKGRKAIYGGGERDSIEAPRRHSSLRICLSDIGLGDARQSAMLWPKPVKSRPARYNNVDWLG
jgi:hypothetical protein